MSYVNLDDLGFNGFPNEQYYSDTVHLNKSGTRIYDARIIFGIILFIIVTYTFNIITYNTNINTMYPAHTDLLVTFRYIHIKIEELYNSQN